jgi:hypothetical protein
MLGFYDRQGEIIMTKKELIEWIQANSSAGLVFTDELLEQVNQLQTTEVHQYGDGCSQIGHVSSMVINMEEQK